MHSGRRSDQLEPCWLSCLGNAGSEIGDTESSWPRWREAGSAVSAGVPARSNYVTLV